MDDQLHIIIAGNRGRVIRLPLSRKKLWLSVCSALIICLSLTIASLFSITLFTENRTIASQLSELREQLRTSAELIAESKKESEEQQLKLNLKVARLELSSVKQAVDFKAEKENLLSTAVNELAERSELIEKMIDSIGIEVPMQTKEGNSNSGGIFIAQPESNSDRDALLNRADKYLKAIRFLPFGRPVDGPVTSDYGKRYDPVNGKSAFHTGIDFRAKPGDEIFATADGVVNKAFYNGGYGNFVLIDHKNGYSTAFSHMKKFLVRRGQKVRRGQLIGFVGNTGRSTGPHLHYEVTLDGETIDPYIFMKVAGSSESPSTTSGTR
ncbi:MAG: peptidoglycan DD-metalloendopeptidase family protein [Proteobacteria bacterium]|nr:peptidoglycan DD-metalloendopeptidase family protein [Pseudomonadota bacterium]